MDQLTDLTSSLQQALGDGYRVTEELGGGGMSRVFVVHEIDLGRDLVVKVLPPELQAGLNTDRFRREIQLSARLQHPHIVPLLFAGARNGLLYYSMPRVEGESLRAKLTRSRELPVGAAIRLLREVADALAYAHAHGVAHRDIKPDNILISGHHALVTDFGVAKALSVSAGLSTLTSAGIALGTPSYMSPEQAVADPTTDERTDIYALGVLGYELLSGEVPFSASTTRQLLAAHVIDRPVPISKKRPGIPTSLANVIMHCLEKRPADRFQSAEEVRQRLEVLAASDSAGIPDASVAGWTFGLRAQRQKVLVVSGCAFAALLVAGFGLSRYVRASNQEFEISVTSQITNDPGIEINPALSPDGTLIAYASGQPERTTILVKQLEGGEPVRVVSGPRAPRWSSDGSKLLYADSAGVVAMPALGGSPRRLITATGGARVVHPAWSHDGQSLAYVSGSGIWIADADGANGRRIATIADPHSISWSRDDTRLALVSGNWASIYGADQFGNMAPSRLWIIGRNGEQASALTDEIHHSLSPVWAADGAGILYVSNIRGGRDLYYQRINGTKAEGPLQRLTTGLRIHGISVEGNDLAYSVWNSSVGIWSLPFPRSGPVSFSRVAARQITSATEIIESVSLSPNGQWLAFDSDRSGNMDIYKVRLDGTELQQLTHSIGDDFRPAWSPDGRQIGFQSWRSGSRDSYVMAADGSSERMIAGGPGHEFAPAWSPDGRHLIFASDRNGGISGSELFIVPAAGGAPRQLTSQGGLWPFWSPDGRTIAYVGGAALRVITPEGSSERVIVPPSMFGPVRAIGGWSADSKRIYFRVHAPDGSRNIVQVSSDGSEPSVLVRFDDPLRKGYRSEFSTDGTNFYVTIGKHEADIWRMGLKRK